LPIFALGVILGFSSGCLKVAKDAMSVLGPVGILQPPRNR
jgi:hypothetical protein